MKLFKTFIHTERDMFLAQLSTGLAIIFGFLGHLFSITLPANITDLAIPHL